MTMASVSPSTTRSMTRTTCGSWIEVRMVRSRMNLATTSGSETSSGLSSLTATGSPVRLTLPANTWPMAPRPSGCCSTYALPSDFSILFPCSRSCRASRQDVRQQICQRRYLHGIYPAVIDQRSAQRHARRENRGRQPRAEQASVGGAGRLQDQPAFLFRQFGDQTAQPEGTLSGGSREDTVTAIPDPAVPGHQL